MRETKAIEIGEADLWVETGGLYSDGIIAISKDGPEPVLFLREHVPALIDALQRAYRDTEGQHFNPEKQRDYMLDPIEVDMTYAYVRVMLDRPFEAFLWGEQLEELLQEGYTVEVLEKFEILCNKEGKPVYVKRKKE